MSGDVQVRTLEERRLDAEIALRTRELDLRDRELEQQQEQARRQSRLVFSPITTSLIAAASVVAGAVLNARYQGQQSIALQRENSQAGIVLQQNNDKANREAAERAFEANLILRMSESGSPNQTLKNLQFLLNVGLIHDRNGRLRAVLRRKEVPSVVSREQAYREAGLPVPPRGVASVDNPGMVPISLGLGRFLNHGVKGFRDTGVTVHFDAPPIKW